MRVGSESSVAAGAARVRFRSGGFMRGVRDRRDGDGLRRGSREAARLRRSGRRTVHFASVAGVAILLAGLASPLAATGVGMSDAAGAPTIRQVLVPTASPEPTPGPVETAPPEATVVPPQPGPAEPTPVPAEPTLVPPQPAAAEPTPEPAPPEPPFPYVERVVTEINTLRAQVGLQPLALAPPEANEGMADYLSVITPVMLATGTCVNGSTLGVGASWDYAAARGYAAEPLGELLTCAGAAYWAPLDNVTGWRTSPELRELLGDTTATTIACGGWGPQPDGRGYRSFVCVTYRAV